MITYVFGTHLGLAIRRRKMNLICSSDVCSSDLRDLGGVYKLLNNTILHNIDTNRILFAINQADVAMKGKHWVNGKPDDVLSDFLNRKTESIQKRIENEIHRKILRPICYSAYNEYNIKVLIDYILDNMCETREI